MSRKSGQVKRVMGRLFKERQIYHRSDGVVHFISMSSQTQIFFAILALIGMAWVAYATVNVVFKEQIIVAKEREFRLMATNNSLNMLAQKKAYDEVNIQNAILQQNYKAALDELAGRHQMLQTAVARQSTVNQDLLDLSERLAEAGPPDGKKQNNSNRVMIDVKPTEPTPRQSRRAKLIDAAAREASKTRTEIKTAEQAGDAVDNLESAATLLYTEQLMLLAELEESATRQAEELRYVLDATGIGAARFLTPAKITNNAFAQGGPFVDVFALDSASPVFIQRVSRANAVLKELESLKEVVQRIPLSSPSISARYMTSPFGVRRDPIHGRLAQHRGLDFRAAWASPVTATADGVVVRAGVWGAFGRMVEIDHGNGFVTRYAHMRRISVKKGQKVKLHDKVGELGSSGRSTGAHIHYEILYKGVHQDPEKFIEAGRYVFES